MQQKTNGSSEEVNKLVDALNQLPAPSPVPERTPEQVAIEHGILSMNKLVNDKHDAERKLQIAEQLIAVNKIEIEGLLAELAASRSRVISYQQERDVAVAERAEWEALFKSIRAQLEAFRVPR